MGSDLSLYNERPTIIGSPVESNQLRVQLWSVNQRAMEVEESPLLRFVTRKRLVKTLQRNSHCGELLLSRLVEVD
jgi:hypothetical protein